MVKLGDYNIRVYTDFSEDHAFFHSVQFIRPYVLLGDAEEMLIVH